MRNRAHALHAAMGEGGARRRRVCRRLDRYRTEDINSFKREMTARFRMSDPCALSYYLGIKVRQANEELTLG